jgi:hypothetical protein
MWCRDEASREQSLRKTRGLMSKCFIRQGRGRFKRSQMGSIDLPIEVFQGDGEAVVVEEGEEGFGEDERGDKGVREGLGEGVDCSDFLSWTKAS